MIDDILERLTRGERLRDRPARLRCKDGSIRDVSSLERPVPHRRFIHTRCFTLDVTERKQGKLRSTWRASRPRPPTSPRTTSSPRSRTSCARRSRPCWRRWARWEHAPAFPDALRDDLEMVRRNVDLEARLIDDLLDLTRIARGKFALQRRSARRAQAARIGREHVPQRDQRQADRPRAQPAGRAPLRPRRPRPAPAGVLEPAEERGEILRRGRADRGLDARSTCPARSRSSCATRASASRRRCSSGCSRPSSRRASRRSGATAAWGSGCRSRASCWRRRADRSRRRARASTAARRSSSRSRASTRPTKRTASRPRNGGNGDDAEQRCFRVLLVEDHVDTARVLARLMRGTGHEVTTAHSVADADRRPDAPARSTCSSATSACPTARGWT